MIIAGIFLTIIVSMNNAVKTLCALQPPLPQPQRTAASAVLVTGSTDGIGMTTAKNMAINGYDVLIHGRDADRIEKAKKTIQNDLDNITKNNNNNKGSKIVALPPRDISTMEGCTDLVNDVKKVCKEESLQLSVLMNNAGVYSEKKVLTSQGLEQTFAVNVLGTFVITSHLLPILLKQPKSRIVIASSVSQCRTVRDWDDLHYYTTRPYSAHSAYSESKLLDAMFTMEFADRLQKAGFPTTKITANCLDPGTVNTKMLLAGWGPIGIQVDDAFDETWLCSSPEVDGMTGKYYVSKNERGSSSSYNQSERDKMWKILSTLAPEAAAMWDFEWSKQAY